MGAKEQRRRQAAVGEIVFNGLQALLDPRNSASRQARAIVRLNRYAGEDTDFEPITELAKARTEEMLGNAQLVRPYIAQVNDAINNTQTYSDGRDSSRSNNW